MEYHIRNLQRLLKEILNLIMNSDVAACDWLIEIICSYIYRNVAVKIILINFGILILVCTLYVECMFHCVFQAG